MCDKYLIDRADDAPKDATIAQPILPGGSLGSVILVVVPRQCRKAQRSYNPSLWMTSSIIHIPQPCPFVQQKSRGMRTGSKSLEYPLVISKR